MSGHGSPTEAIADRLRRELAADREDGALPLRVAVVAASWHEEVMGGLLAGARRRLAHPSRPEARGQGKD